MENQENTNKKSFAPVLVVAVLAVAIVGWMVWSSQQKSQPEPTAMKQQNEVTQPQDASTGSAGEQAEVDTSTVKEITVEGGMFYFKPNEIKVKKGETVKITFNNTQGMHDFVIDELNVKSEVINAGATTTVEFTPDKTGSFEFYCSVGNHRAQGMKGTLVVE